MGILEGRFVVPKQKGAVPFSGSDAPSGTLERIVKYVPVEIIAIYTAVIGIFATAQATPRWAVVAMVVLALVAIVVVIVRGAPEPSVRKAHLCVTPLAFVVWAYPISSALIGNWFIGWVSALMQGAVLLLAYAVDPQK